MTADERSRWECLAHWLEQQPGGAATRAAMPTEHDALLAPGTPARTARLRAAVVHFRDGHWRIIGR